MNSKAQGIFKLILLSFLVLGGVANLSGCGVKSDPLPPLAPIDIGHGKPVYKNDEDTSPARQQPLQPLEDKENKDDQDDED